MPPELDDDELLLEELEELDELEDDDELEEDELEDDDVEELEEDELLDELVLVPPQPTNVATASASRDRISPVGLQQPIEINFFRYEFFMCISLLNAN